MAWYLSGGARPGRRVRGRGGRRDQRAAPATSLTFGLAALKVPFSARGGAVASLAGLSTFAFGGPQLAVVRDEGPQARPGGRRTDLSGALRLAGSILAAAMVLAILLRVGARLWIRAAMLVRIVVPAAKEQGIGDRLPFRPIGGAVGGPFRAGLFVAAGFSLPLVVDRRVATVTAVRSRVRAARQPGANRLLRVLAIAALSVPGNALASVALVPVGP